jgi:SAM-dependent MidA family methyltransferase
VSYDPEARRDTPLAVKLKERIRRHGPIRVSEYMRACLHDPEHGYYVRQPAIGTGGDFITAPEISQIFGELIGLWCAVVWQQMGSPSRINLVEWGPGRGTMMRDMLRAAARVPGFLEAARAQLLEPSPRLRDIQRETLADAPIPVSHIEAAAPPDGPTLVIANEVLDCVPIDQRVLEVDSDGKPAWFERTVLVDEDDRLQFGAGRHAELSSHEGMPDCGPGDLLESGGSQPIFEALGHAHAGQPFAALFIDYGYTAIAAGDTLQAVRGHVFEHPLTSPGEADLTAHVNFAQVAQEAIDAGLAADGPITQAEFLGRMGIIERASRLMSANPAKAAQIETGVARLVAPGGMGTWFKAMGVRRPGLPPLPGF